MKKSRLFPMKNTLKAFLKFALFAILLIATKRFCKKATEGFTIANITKEIFYFQEKTPYSFTEEEKKQFDDITSQKFTYLAKGAQCYAFVSEDGSYVIKFFKKNTLSVPPFLEHFPFEFIKEKKELKQNKLQQEFGSYEIALDELKNETGLLFLHLRTTNHLHKTITIIDRLNIEHKIDLDKIEFLIQKKGDLIYPSLDKLMKNGKTEDAKHLIASIFEIIEKRASKKIIDTDPNISKNFACLGNMAIQIDIGRFRKVKNSETTSPLYLERMREDFRKWIILHHPELLSHFDEKYDVLIQKGSF